MINSIRHAAIVVENINQAVKFYTSLGFKISSKAIEQGKFIDSVTGLDNVKLEWVKLKTNNNFLLELLSYHSHPAISKKFKQRSNQLGCSHIAYGVDNINETCDQILKNGGEIVNKPKLNNDGSAKVAYCHDLEGVLFEIVEVIKNG